MVLAMHADPFKQFDDWYATAGAEKIPMPEVMHLATIDDDGFPTVRCVLLRDRTERGFRFFTNYESRKARALAATPKAGLNFYWASVSRPLGRQVRVGGAVERISSHDSDAYFRSRPRGHQIGAWASLQSQPLASRKALEQRARDMEARFQGQDVPRPEGWGGFIVVPTEIEFWEGREDRLHDRHRYTRLTEHDATWRVTRLYP